MRTAKIILVTGGNRGIGKEICRQLAAAGHHIILGSRDLNKGEAAAKEMKGKVDALALDMTDFMGMNQLVHALGDRYGHLDVLINNAGIISTGARVDTAAFPELRKVIETNFWGPLYLSKALLPLLRQSSDPRIINMSSDMGQLSGLADGSYAGYRLSKASLNAMTIQMAADLGDTFHVHAMSPGWVKTDMGGQNAHRTVDQGADTAVWLATAEGTGTGKFWRDREVIPW